LLVLISLLVLVALLYPRSALEAPIQETERLYSDTFLVAENKPTIYKISPRIKEWYQDPELYQYFIDKSMETDIDIIYNIEFADCLIISESGWNPNAKNPISTAHGLGQFLDSTWNNVNRALGGNLDRNNPYDQIDAYIYLLSTDGYKHWEVYPSCTYLLPIEKRVASLK